MRSVLVTGGCGFIASNLLNTMVLKYPNVHFINVDRMDYCASAGNITVKDKPNYTFHEFDIADSTRMLAIIVESCAASSIETRPF